MPNREILSFAEVATRTSTYSKKEQNWPVVLKTCLTIGVLGLIGLGISEVVVQAVEKEQLNRVHTVRVLQSQSRAEEELRATIPLAIQDATISMKFIPGIQDRYGTASTGIVIDNFLDENQKEHILVLATEHGTANTDTQRAKIITRGEPEGFYAEKFTCEKYQNIDNETAFNDTDLSFCDFELKDPHKISSLGVANFETPTEQELSSHEYVSLGYPLEFIDHMWDPKFPMASETTETRMKGSYIFGSSVTAKGGSGSPLIDMSNISTNKKIVGILKGYDLFAYLFGEKKTINFTPIPRNFRETYNRWRSNIAISAQTQNK